LDSDLTKPSFLIVSTVLLLYSINTSAQYPEITGTWTGTVSGNYYICTNPHDAYSFTAPGKMIISNQRNGYFDVMVTGPKKSKGAGKGVFLDIKAIEIIGSELSETSTDLTTVSGKIEGDTISFTFSGFNTRGTYCYWSGHGFLTYGNNLSQ